MDTQFLVVGISNTIHLVATVLWIGWSILLPLVVAPRAIDAHKDNGSWIAALSRRFPPVAYAALAALAATGMVQMGAHPEYEGMFAVANVWSTLLFVKHMLVLLSILVILYLSQSVSPRLRLANRRAALGKANELGTLSSRFRFFAWLNLVAGIGVLLLTGFMTAVR